jgi:glyoxylase-like metal-dependent hydrolase (beta-lactamase superfamily II)
MILKKFVSGPLKTNTILMGSSRQKKAFVIDPASAKEEILATLVKLDLQLEYIFLTHGHFDHIGDVASLKSTTQAKVCIHSEDASMIIDPLSQGVYAFFQNLQPVQPDHLFNEDEIIPVGDVEVKVVFTPGHTLGSCCFWIEKEKLLISGDTLFKRGLGRTTDKEKMLFSLKKLSLLNPETRVIPGHGPETTIAQEKWLKNPEKVL